MGKDVTKRSLRTMLAYEGLSLKREPGLICLVLVTPALVLLLLNWLLNYILNSNLIASEVPLPMYFPLEKVGVTPTELTDEAVYSSINPNPTLFYFYPNNQEAEQISFDVLDTIVTYNRALLEKRAITDSTGFYSKLTTAHYHLFYRGFDSREEMARYASLPIFYATNCTSADYTGSTIDEILAEHKALGCEGSMVVTPDTYVRYNVTHDYIDNNPEDTFQPTVFTLDLSPLLDGTDDPVTIHYNSTAYRQIQDTSTKYLGKDFYSTAGTVFYLGLQRAAYLFSLSNYERGLTRQADTSNPYPLPLLTPIPVPERIIPPIYPAQSGAFIMVLGVVSVNIVATIFVARDRGKDHSTLRLLGVSEGAYWLVRWLVATPVVFLSAAIFVLSGRIANILPMAGFTVGFLLILALLLTFQAVGFGLFLSAAMGRSGVIAPLVATLIVSILCNVVVTAVFRLTYNTGSIFDSTIMPAVVTWILTILLPPFTVQNIFDFMALVLPTALRGKTATVSSDTRTNPTGVLSCGMRCYTDVLYGNLVYNGEFIGAKQVGSSSPAASPAVQTYTVPPATTFCAILVTQFVLYSVTAGVLGYTISEPMYRGINLFKVLCQCVRQRRAKGRRLKVVSEVVRTGNLDGPRSDKDSQIAIACSNLRIKYNRGKKQIAAVDNFSFIAQKGAIVALLGTNGAGKSSVMAVLAGEQTVQKGLEPMVLGEHDIRHDYEMLQARSEIGKCPQHNQNVFESFTVAENMLLCALQRGALEDCNSSMRLLVDIPRKAERVIVEPASADATNINNDTAYVQATEASGKLGAFTKYVAMLNLDSSALKKRANTLSGGMKRRLSLINATIGLHNGVVFLDEVSTGLDPLTCKNLHTYIEYVARQSKNTVVLTTHNMSDVEALADHVVVMKHGLTVAKGTVDEVCSILSCYNVTLYADTIQQVGSGSVSAHPLFEQQCKEIAKQLHAYISKNTDTSGETRSLLCSRTICVLRLPGTALPALPAISKYLTDTLTEYDAISSFIIETATLDDVFIELAADNDQSEYTSTSSAALYRSNVRHIRPRLPYSEKPNQTSIERAKEDDICNRNSPYQSSSVQLFTAGMRRLAILEGKSLRFGFLPVIMIFLIAILVVVAICKGLTVSLNSYVKSYLNTFIDRENVETLIECISCCNPLFRNLVVSQLVASGNSALAQNATYVDGVTFLVCAAVRPTACFSDSANGFYTPSSCQSFLMLQGWDVMALRARSTRADALSQYFTNNEVPYYLIGSSDGLFAAQIRSDSRKGDTPGRVKMTTYSAPSAACEEFLEICAHGCAMAAILHVASDTELYNATLCNKLCDAIAYGKEVEQELDVDVASHEFYMVCIDDMEYPGLVLDTALTVEDVFLNNIKLQKTAPHFDYSEDASLTEEGTDCGASSRVCYRRIAHQKFAQMSPLLYIDWRDNEARIYGTIPDIVSGDYSYNAVSAQLRLPYTLSTNKSLYPTVLGTIYPTNNSFITLSNVSEPGGTENIRMRGYDSGNDFTSLIRSALPTRYTPEPVNLYTNVLSLFLHARFEEQRRVLLATEGARDSVIYAPVPRITAIVQALPYVADKEVSFMGTAMVASVSFLLLPPVFMAPILYVPMNILKEREGKLSTMLSLHFVTREMQVFTTVLYYLLASVISAALAISVGLVLRIESFMSSWAYILSMLVGLSYSSAVLGACITRLVNNVKIASFAACCFIILCFMVSVFIMEVSPLCIIVTPLYFLVLLQKGGILSTLQTSWLDFFVGALVTTGQLLIVVHKTWARYSDGVVNDDFVDDDTDMLNRSLSRAATEYAMSSSLLNAAPPPTGDSRLHCGLCEHVSLTPSLSVESVLQSHEADAIKLHVANLSHHYGKHRVLDSVGLDIRNGEIAGLVGLSGSGKTTLINCLAKIVVPEAGEAVLHHAGGATDLFSNSNAQEMKDAGVAAPLFLVPQEDLLYPDLTVMDHLRLFAPLYGYSCRGLYVNGLLTGLSLFAHRKKRIRELSGGMRRRVSLILALIGCRHILCLDEFTTGLSINIKRSVWQSVIRIISDMRLSVILTSHDMYELEFFCMNVSVLHKGRIVYAGKTQEMGHSTAVQSQKAKVASQCIMQLRCPDEEIAHILHVLYEQFGASICGTSILKEDTTYTGTSKTSLIRASIAFTDLNVLTDVFTFLCTYATKYKWLVGFSKLEARFLRIITSDAFNRPAIKQVCNTEGAEDVNANDMHFLK